MMQVKFTLYTYDITQVTMSLNDSYTPKQQVPGVNLQEVSLLLKVSTLDTYCPSTSHHFHVSHHPHCKSYELDH